MARAKVIYGGSFAEVLKRFAARGLSPDRLVVAPDLMREIEREAARVPFDFGQLQSYLIEIIEDKYLPTGYCVGTSDHDEHDHQRARSVGGMADIIEGFRSVTAELFRVVEVRGSTAR